MAGWIKVEKDLLNDPRLLVMARRLAEIDRRDWSPRRLLATCVGAVCILWITADTHVDQDDVLALGPADIDELTGVEGFCDLMPTEWLEVLDPTHVKLPGFHAHNGTSAKMRAQNSARQQVHRNTRALRKRNGHA